MVTPKEVRELLDYDPSAGALVWRERSRERFSSERMWKSWNSRFAGREAGVVHCQPGGYRRIQVGILGEKLYAHQLAWMWMTGDPPPPEIDHDDRDGTNNAWGNLRSSTREENCKNYSMSRRNKSGVTGVFWVQRIGKWWSYIRRDGRQVTLGYYADWFDAVCARKSAEVGAGFSAGHGRPRPY